MDPRQGVCKRLLAFLIEAAFVEQELKEIHDDVAFFISVVSLEIIEGDEDFFEVVV